MRRGCIVCGGSGHSHRTCVLLSAAIHHKSDLHKDMMDVVDVILSLLLWNWRPFREARIDVETLFLNYAPSCDVFAARSQSGKHLLIIAHTGQIIRHLILCPIAVDVGFGGVGFEASVA